MFRYAFHVQIRNDNSACLHGFTVQIRKFNQFPQTPSSINIIFKVAQLKKSVAILCERHAKP